jgi:hypothetical protein
MNAEENDLVMVFLNFIWFIKGFLSAEGKAYTNTTDSGAAPEEMFWKNKILIYVLWIKTITLRCFYNVWFFSSLFSTVLLLLHQIF